MKQSGQIVPQWVLFITATLCLVAIADLPYGYYQLLRWIVCGSAVAAAFQLHAAGRTAWVWILAFVAVVFNPIAPIHLDKETWRFLDAGAGICFLVIAFLSRKPATAS